MWMRVPSFVPVLGNPRVIAGALDAEHRVLAYDGEQIVGMAAFERLYGPRAEGVITLAGGASGGLVNYLLDGLLERAERSGVMTISFSFDVAEQHALAERLVGRRPGWRLRRDGLDIRLGAGRPAIGHVNGHLAR